MSPPTPRHYPSDLPESQRALLERFLPEPKSGPGKPGRPAIERERLLNALLYVVKTGCQWRQVPPEFGPWPTVYGYFHRCSRLEVWRGLMEALTALERVRQGRHPEPTAGSVDSQRVNTATQGTAVGFDGGKRGKGRQRHLLTATLGRILWVVVTAAQGGDREGLKALLTRWFILGVCRLRTRWVDAGYDGQPLKDWVRGLKRTHQIALEVVEHQGQGFQVVPKRWVVERAFAWLLPLRRPSQDYEGLTRNREALIQIARCSLLVRRLA